MQRKHNTVVVPRNNTRRLRSLDLHSAQAMNVQKILTHSAIPGAVALAAGLVMYMLTGGEEEFPSPPATATSEVT